MPDHALAKRAADRHHPADSGPSGRRAGVRAAARTASLTQSSADTVSPDLNPRTSALVQMAHALDEGPIVESHLALQRAMNQRPKSTARSEATRTPSALSAKRPNATGLPDRLKADVESLSGLSMEDVRVHYNSSKPAAVQAYAYTQGTDIHVAPGQQRHLPHEDVAINDDPGLEREGDVIGPSSLRVLSGSGSVQLVSNGSETIQRKLKLTDIAPTELQNIDLDESHLDSVWGVVASLLSDRGLSRYGRRKKLTEHLKKGDTLGPMNLEEYVEHLIEETPIRKEQGRERPDWDPFWKSVETKGLHRRHVVISSVMRDAVYAVTDKIKKGKNGTQKDNLKEMYTKHSSVAATSLEDAEAALVSKLHNHKLNIFIGEGSWNSAIGGLAHVSVQEFLDMAENAPDVATAKLAVESFIKALRNANVFGMHDPRNEIVKITEDRLSKVGTDWSGSSLISDPELDLIKKEVFEVIESTWDSVASDISQAQNPSIARHQNQLFNFNKEFLDIAKSGNETDLNKTITNFLEREDIASVKELDSPTTMSAVQFFGDITHFTKRPVSVSVKDAGPFKDWIGTSKKSTGETITTKPKQEHDESSSEKTKERSKEIKRKLSPGSGEQVKEQASDRALFNKKVKQGLAETQVEQDLGGMQVEGL